MKRDWIANPKGNRSNSKEMPETKWLMKKLKRAIDKSGLSLTAFSLKNGMHGTMVCQYLKGRCAPTFWMGVRIANTIGADLRELQK